MANSDGSENGASVQRIVFLAVLGVTLFFILLVIVNGWY